MAKDKQTLHNTTQQIFPPVVAVLGHVDHGKTTLLDTMRKTSIAEREKGGITQKIGASTIEIMHEGSPRFITFIDTPGHEAFAQMRSRGAQAADIALLIISAIDGVKPQTRESIKVLKDANIPFIVVLTKSDLPTKNLDRVKQELLKEQIMLEGYGGDVPVVDVSAKTNHNIKELLDLILLVFDLQKKSENIQPNAPLSAIVIESRLDIRTGAKATIVIKNGTMKIRDTLYVENQTFRVRTLLSDLGKSLQQATIGDAIEIIGFEKVPLVGSIITNVAPSATTQTMPDNQKQLTREMVYHRQKEAVGISVILVADTQGSLEAIIQAFPSEIKIVEQKTGEVREADVLLAKSTGSIILSFNTKVKPEIQQLAFAEKVLVRNYEIIYELLDELSDALEGKLLSQMEQVFGKAKILAKFPFEKSFAFGITVTEGRIARSDKVRLERENEIIGETTLTSLRVGKNSTSKIEKGHEAGIVFAAPLDIQVGDMIISHS